MIHEFKRVRETHTICVPSITLNSAKSWRISQTNPMMVELRLLADHSSAGHFSVRNSSVEELARNELRRQIRDGLLVGDFGVFNSKSNKSELFKSFG